jgi:hypothetical protein
MTPPHFVGLRRPQAGSSTRYTNGSLPDRQGEPANAMNCGVTGK